MDNAQRMMMEGQAQRNAAGDQGTRKNGFLLNLLPRVPDAAGDAIWGIGSRVSWWIKKIPGAVLGLFGSEMMPNKAELMALKMHEDIKGASDAQMQQLAQAAQANTSMISAAPMGDTISSGLPRPSKSDFELVA